MRVAMANDLLGEGRQSDGIGSLGCDTFTWPEPLTNLHQIGIPNAQLYSATLKRLSTVLNVDNRFTGLVHDGRFRNGQRLMPTLRFD